MISIPRNYVAPVRERREVSMSDRVARALEWIEHAHSRRPRQEFWQWLQMQVRQGRAGQ